MLLSAALLVLVLVFVFVSVQAPGEKLCEKGQDLRGKRSRMAMAMPTVLGRFRLKVPELVPALLVSIPRFRVLVQITARAWSSISLLRCTATNLIECLLISSVAVGFFRHPAGLEDNEPIITTFACV